MRVVLLPLVWLGACTPADTEPSPDTEPAATEAPEPFYLVSNAPTGAMNKHAPDGSYLGDLIAPNTVLDGASQIDLTPDGRTLLVSSFSDSVHTFDAITGEDLGAFPPNDALRGVSVFAYRPDGVLLVSDFKGGAVHAFDLEERAWLGEFFAPGHLTNPHEVVHIHDSYLVADYGAGAIVRFNTDGSFRDVLADGPDLRGPLGMIMAPDGERLLVTNNHTGRVSIYDPQSGEHLGVLAQDIGLMYPEGMELTPEGELLVASPRNTTIFRISADDGAVLGQFEQPAAAEGTVDVLWVAPQ